jgi:peroxiredoxin
MDRLAKHGTEAVLECHLVNRPFHWIHRMAIVLWVYMAMGSIQSIYAVDNGSKIDNFQLPDTAGTIYSLRSYSGKIVVLIFWSFKCPVSHLYADRMNQFKDKYANKDVIVLGVDSAANETPTEIRANIENMKIKTPILLDEDGALAQKVGATQTPSVMVIDGTMILRYRGALDNNRKTGEKGRIAYAEDAVDALLAGRSIPISETRPFGCSIRRQEIRE